MKKHIFLTIALSLIAGMLYAQSTVTGVVTDVTKEALPGVAVTVQGTTRGVATDVRGRYSISVAKGETLNFSLLGMLDQSVKIGDQKVVNIQMAPAAINMDEIVAIGYGVSRKSDLTGSVASIKPEGMQNSKVGTATSALQGLAAGVMVTTGSQKPGGDASVLIRGAGSINAGNTPLFVVDGVPVQDGLQDLSTIDVESIEVLKDASSAAIYGSRGSNGVVLVTTRRGTKGAPKITLNASWGTQRMLNKQDMMNAQQYYDLVSATQPVDYKWTADELRQLSAGRSTDWQDAVTQNGSYQNYNLSVSTGGEKATHYFGLDYYDQTGTVRNSSFDKFTVRYNMDSKLNDWSRMGLRFNVIESALKNINEEGDELYGTVFSALTSQPTAPIYTADGEYYQGFLNTKANPVAVVDLLDKATLKTRIVGSFYLEAEPIKNLVLRSDNGGEFVFFRVNNYEDGRMGVHYNPGGTASVMANKKRYWQTENTATYTHAVNQHRLTGMVGFSASRIDYEESTALSKDGISPIMRYYNLGAGSEHGPNGSWASASTLASFYGRVTYDYDSRYLATFNMRADGSSRFAKGHQWGYFPSLALAWRIKEEKFMEDADWLTNLKLRVSAGMLGNQNLGDFASLARVSLGGPGPNYVFNGTLLTGSVQTSIANPDLTWEKANQFDLGVDFGFLNNRIAGTVDLYFKRTTDLLFSVPLPLESGFGTSMTNVGKVDNKGIEFSLTTVNITTKNVYWTTTGMISFNQNKVKELYDGKQDIGKWLFVGRPISQIYTTRSLGVWQKGEETQAAVYGCLPGDRKVFDKDESGSITGEDREFCGQTTPKYFGSLSSNLRVKDFDLTLFFTFAGGHMINNSMLRFLNSYNVWGNMSVDYYNNYWKADRPNNKYPAPRVGSPYANGDGTDANYQKGDYLRLRNIELGYTLPANLSKYIGTSKLRAYFSVQNLFTLTEFTGYDVEAYQNSNPYPNARSFIGGISLTF